MESVTLSIRADYLAIIDQALQGMPFRVAAPIIAEINRQIAEQASKPDPDPRTAPGQEI